MENMEQELKMLGLTDNEIKIYLMLLENPNSSGTKIRQTTGISNSAVYASIDVLINKGLVIYQKLPTGKMYSALDPEVINSILEQQRKKIEAAIPQLKELTNKTNYPTETAVYEGFNGFKTALTKLAEDCPKGETIDIIGFSNQAYKNEKLAFILQDVNKISIKKKHKFRMILDNKENIFYKGRKEEGISQIRFMGKGFKSPASIDIFGDNVYILMWDEQPYAFVIKNKNIAQGFKVYFEFLWNLARG